MKAPKPTPIPENLICSVCELDWKLHPEGPTVEDCIVLLKKEVRKAPPSISWTYPYHTSWTNPDPGFTAGAATMIPIDTNANT